MAPFSILPRIVHRRDSGKVTVDSGSGTSTTLMKVSDDSTSYKEAQQKLENAKMLLHTNPNEAARLYYQIGTCHRIWAHKQRILKEKYGMTWYTPTEVNPHIIFD